MLLKFKKGLLFFHPFLLVYCATEGTISFLLLREDFHSFFFIFFCQR